MISEDVSVYCTSPKTLINRDEVLKSAHELFLKGDIDLACEKLMSLEFSLIDNKTIKTVDNFLPYIKKNKKVIASFDPKRKPAKEELVFIYGNYPHAFYNLIINNPVKRHAACFSKFTHDHVEYDTRWDGIEMIYIINDSVRIDRKDSILKELAHAKAPFQRIKWINAEKSDSHESEEIKGHVGCMKSHLKVLHMAREQGFNHILVLEDDFNFTSELDQHLDDLSTFFSREYDYLLCLLGTSKEGRIIPKDDLLSFSFQPCTNTEAYLISKQGIQALIPVYEDGLKNLIKSGNSQQYAADRCWSTLQATKKFFVFRKKFGFQISNFSSIENRITRYLD